MSLILKGAFDITYSIVNAVVHVLLRDLTNYYWYLEDIQQQSVAEVEGLISSLNEDSLNHSVPSQPGESIEFLSTTGLMAAENIPNESFCTTLDLKESIPNITGDITGSEENTTDQDCNINHKDIPNLFDDFNSLENLEQQLSNNEQLTFNEIPSAQVILQNENSFNCLRSPKKENIWIEIENFKQNTDNINFNHDFLNVAERELSKNTMENLAVESVALTNTQTEHFEIGSEGVEHLQSQLENYDLGGSIETESTEKNEQPLLPQLGTLLQEKENFLQENGEELFFAEMKILQREFEEIHFTDDKISAKTILCNRVKSSEIISIGDRKKSETELQPDGKSDISIECELGIRNFQIQNLIDECSKARKSEAAVEQASGKKKPLKSKISRYVGKTTSQKVNEEETTETNKLIEPKLPSEEDEKINLQPVTYDEITNTQSLLNELQDRTESESNSSPTKFIELQDELAEISKVSPEISDLRSVCSDDSWDSWLGKFVTIMRSKSPPARDGTFTVKSEVLKEEDLCDCTNTHRCLHVVDSDEEVTEDLLTHEQLGSVETGSVSDWLYRVNQRSPLLSYTLKMNRTEQSTTVEQEQKTKHYSDSSDEEIAKKFFIQQWLDETETFYTDFTAKFIGSGDVI